MMTREQIESLCRSLASEQGSEAIQQRMLELRDLALRGLEAQRRPYFERLHTAALPFVSLMRGTSGRIPVERLSFADWHELIKAHDDCPPPPAP